MDAGLLPVKALAHAKRRLAPGFGARERLEIARALLLDALQLCTSVAALRWWVVSDDDEVRAAAAGAGLGILPEGRGGLNGALGGALRQLASAGAVSATVVPVDVPLALREDIEDILDTGATSDLVVVPARRGGGTNALHLTPPTLIDPRFGEGSLRAHVEAAERRSLRCSVLPLTRVALDIDTPQDVDDFVAAAGAGGHTARLLRSLGRPLAGGQRDAARGVGPLRGVDHPT